MSGEHTAVCPSSEIIMMVIIIKKRRLARRRLGWTIVLSQCSIEFVHLEIIEIDQPSFMSRQHVVAYRVGSVALLDLALPPDIIDGGS